MKEKHIHQKIWPLPVKNFKKFFLWHQAVHRYKYGSTNLCDQNFGVQSADRQTHGQTDRKVKYERPKILSNDIFFFKIDIIGGPISCNFL